MPLGGLILLAHGGPNVGVDHVDAGHRVGRVVELGYHHAGGRQAIPVGLRQPVAGWPGEPDFGAQHPSRQCKRPEHVVAVTDVGDSPAGKVAELLL